MLKNLVEKVDNIYEQIGNFSGEVKTIRESHGNATHTHTHTSEIKNSFDGLNSRLDPAEEIINDLQERSIGITQIVPQ